MIMTVSARLLRFKQALLWQSPVLSAYMFKGYPAMCEHLSRAQRWGCMPHAAQQ
jgi:hypothetical protein